ncbi:MAG TPA: alkaline phosphatase family protein [Candidatus Cybelea sp.]|nr:alkaline phosphatase family protein [Candidatus Cybelea sp.]
MTRVRFSTVVALAFASATAAGCGNGAQVPGASLPAGARNPATASSPSPIQHVVLMIQENRTFNDFFATFPGADGTTTANVEAEPNCSPPIQKGAITLSEANLILPKDLDHRYSGFKTARDRGKMDGFDKVTFGDGTPECTYPYMYTDPSQITEYWSLAQQYALAEHMFTVQGSDSFTAHQDLIAGGTIVAPKRAMVDLPTCGGAKCVWGCDAPPGTLTHLITPNDHELNIRTDPGPFPCSNQFSVTYPTMRDLLDAKYVSWKYYVPPNNTVYGKLFSAFDLVYPVRYGSEWGTNIISPETQIINDVYNGKLAAMSWVVPDVAESDHPGNVQDTGPSWIASVVNAIGQSSYWNSTAIVIVWDDWGGLYDNISPKNVGYGGLGLRVPAIIVSPYAKPGYISQTNYDFGSILKYVENNWNLGNLGGSDESAASIIDCFDYNQEPRRFKVIPTTKHAQYFLHRKPSFRPPDDDF